jgi:hypothetical protein
MTGHKEKQMEKERQKALNELLVAECKSPYANLDSVRTLLENGAEVGFKYAEPLRWAVKRMNFDLIKFLIKNGALQTEIAYTYLAQMCNQNFDDKDEPVFFEILDMAHRADCDYMTLFTPYINQMAVHGRLDKLRALQRRYYLTEAEIAGAVERRVIFEVVIQNHDEMLAFIERHQNWFDQESFDLAVDSGEWIVLEHLLKNGVYFEPSDKAVAKAVYDGCLEILDMLLECGYDFLHKPVFLEKACRAAYSRGTRSLEYLLRHGGYTLTDSYNGKTVLENAEFDRNVPLLEYLTENHIA